MKNIGKILLMFGCVCFSFAAQAEEKQTPEWIGNPTAHCSENEFCVVGIGSSEKKADADAAGALAKIFQSKVNASFSSSVSSENDNVSTAMQDNLSAAAEATLNSMEIKARFEKNGTFYAFGILNKNKSAEIVKNKITDIDEKIEAFLSDDRAVSARQAEKLYEKRLLLNQQYIVLTGKGIPSVFGYDDVFKNKRAVTDGKKLHLKIVGTANPGFKKLLKNTFKSGGFDFVSDKNASANTLIAKVIKEQQHFEVEGMVKYEYTISLRLIDSNNEETTLMDETFTGAGYGEKQAFQEALGEFERYLKANFDDFEI